MKRTLENCRLVKVYGTPNQYDGKCEGFGTSDIDDEPCEVCKRCPLHYINAEEKEEQHTR